MVEPCLHCLFRCVRCADSKLAQESGYCKWLTYGEKWGDDYEG